MVMVAPLTVPTAAGQPGVCRATIRDLWVDSSENVGYWPDYFNGGAGARSLEVYSGNRDAFPGAG